MCIRDRDLGELSFGWKVLDDDIGEALALALSAKQPLVCLLGYGYGLGGSL